MAVLSLAFSLSLFLSFYLSLGFSFFIIIIPRPPPLPPIQSILLLLTFRMVDERE